MEIKIVEKVYNSHLYRDFVNLYQSAYVYFPSDYSECYDHYVSYLEDTNCVVKDMKVMKMCFNLSHYLDDVEYLKACLTSYYCLLAEKNRSRYPLIEEQNDDNRKELINCLKCFYWNVVGDHQDFMKGLNENLRNDIYFHLPYFLLPQEMINDEKFFKLWLRGNFNKTYYFSDLMSFVHKGCYYGKAEGEGGKIKSFVTGWCSPPLIKWQQHGLNIMWGKTCISSRYEIQFGKRHGKGQEWYVSDSVRQDTTWVDGVLNGPCKIWKDGDQLKTEYNCVNGHIHGNYIQYQNDDLLIHHYQNGILQDPFPPNPL